jgi:exopolysaccharide biosynthesis polyprenyl glycosylphosphotransferase
MGCENCTWDGDIAKRLFDIAASATALLLLSPLFLIVALLIRLDSKGPIFFSQSRVGKQGQKFRFWKFRSMSIDAEKHKAALRKLNQMQGGVLFKMKNDPRITRVGSFIRKSSIDELPQLWNVLIGDMSLVGPRPPLPDEVAQYTFFQRQRLEVTPGITCIWQVSGRSEIPFAQQVKMDLEYIANQSFWYDMGLLLKTIPAVLKTRGAF